MKCYMKTIWLILYGKIILMNKKIISLLGIASTTLISKVYAVTAWTLRWESSSSQIPHDQTHIYWGRSVFDMINFVNSYLRFAIWFVCFLFMIINGYKLITAHGDEKQTKEATSALMKSIIWIAVCLLAYINVAVKLFA